MYDCSNAVRSRTRRQDGLVRVGAPGVADDAKVWALPACVYAFVLVYVCVYVYEHVFVYVYI